MSLAIFSWKAELMRLIIWLAVPVGGVAAIATATILAAWAGGTDLCGTWLSIVLPFCR